MEKETLQKLALKYLSGTATDREKQELHEWYDENQGFLEQEVRIRSEEDKEDVRLRVLDQLKREMGTDRQNPVSGKWLWGLSVAASLTLLIGFGIFYFGLPGEEQWVFAETSYGEIKEVILSDSSVVWINAGSKIKYPKVFGKQTRSVELLDGQAYFDVKRHKDWPFYVDAKGMKVSVLGTSFDVKSYAGETSARVSVLSGKVEVAYGQEETLSRVSLIEGDQAEMDYSEGYFVKSKQPTDAIAAWKDRKLIFANEKMVNVIKALERRYVIDLELQSPELEEETLSIKLDNQPLTDVLEVLKYTMGYQYRKIGEQKIEIMK